MSGNNDEESAVQELVIIRRRAGDGEDGHHGGVWKIAYADFMTAMMAFFLVMWLINATDNKVLTQVATYFNPLRLTDRAPTPRGMYDADSGAPGQENEAGESKVKDGKAKATKIGPVQQKMLEDAMFRDPYGTLEKLAQEAAANEPKEQRRASGGKHEQAEGTLAGGEAFRDPFDPEFRQSVSREVVIRSKQDAADAKNAERTGVAESASQGEKPAADDGKLTAQRPAGDGAKDAQSSERQAAAQNAAVKVAEQADAAKIEAEIRQAIGQAGAGTAPDIEVRVAEDGVLISLTDKADFGMFAIASAEPRPAMVGIMENIGKVLKARQGKIVVRGHTDGRPFRSASYDNWRLSTARAHMAYYMLVRGGIDEKRFSRVEGHADRDLKVTADPEAAQNRRIEILLKENKS